jgi:hypothetical protein
MLNIEDKKQIKGWQVKMVTEEKKLVREKGW